MSFRDIAHNEEMYAMEISATLSSITDKSDSPSQSGNPTIKPVYPFVWPRLHALQGQDEGEVVARRCNIFHSLRKATKRSDQYASQKVPASQLQEC